MRKILQKEMLFMKNIKHMQQKEKFCCKKKKHLLNDMWGFHIRSKSAVFARVLPQTKNIDAR